MKLLLSLSFCLSVLQLCLGQQLDVERERFPGIKEVEITAFSRIHPEIQHSAKYLINKLGQPYKSKHYIKRRFWRRLWEAREYHYNSFGLLTKEIVTYSVNNHGILIADSLEYTVDSSGIVFSKQLIFDVPGPIEYYSDFNDFKKPTKAKWVNSKGDISYSRMEYDSLGRLTCKEFIENDSLPFKVIVKYNSSGDMIYYLRASSLKDENIFGKAEHIYDYEYDEKNRQAKNYTVNCGIRTLAETRRYK